MKRVVSIRIEPSTLAGVYDFLEHICSYDTSHLPVSTATQIAMEAIVEWFRRKGELPQYANDEAALARIGDNGRYVPGASLPDAIERIAPIPMGRKSSILHKGHTSGKIYPAMSYPVEALESPERVIEQNLNDNSTHTPRQHIDPNILKGKQEHMISLIDKFMAREEEDDLHNMIVFVKEEKIYKEEV